MEDLISVVIPVYNVKPYLERCINSVVNQTYKNLEIILVDDGSTDGSDKICDDYSKKYKNIEVIHKKNGGLSDARNVGIENAHGQYIQFIDSDDYVNNKMIEILYNNLKNTNSDISVCRPYSFSNVSEIKDYKIEENLVEYEGIDILKNMYNDYLVTVVAWNKLYKKSIFDNIRYPKGGLIEDSAILHYLLTSINKIVYSNLELYYYYQRESSIMHKTNYKLLDELDWLYDRINFFKNKGYEKENFFKETIEKYYEAFLNWTYILTKDNGYKSKYMNKYFDQCKEVFELYKNISYNSKINLVLKFKWVFFYLKGLKRVIYKVKNVIEQKIKERNFKSRYNQYLKNIGKTEKYLIFNAPDHGNIGDHAILFAEEEFIKDKGHKSFAIVSNEIDLFIKNFSDTVEKDDFILITGGGNLGTLWEHEQNNVNKVIEKYNNNKIIVFPQTVYYSNDYHGKYRLEKDKAIYKSCSNLTFVCRDSKSFDLMKNVFKINALQTSDIVTYLNYSEEKNLDRKNILFCLRKDKEKVSNENDIKKIIQYFNEKLPNEKIIFVDTVFPGKFSLNKGKKYLMKFLNKTKKSKIFITDRLHGMIFATITGTPCIAMANSSGKVKGVHKWISQNNDFVKFIENFEDFEKQIKEFDFEKNNIYNNEEIRKNFNRIPIGEKNG